MNMNMAQKERTANTDICGFVIIYTTVDHPQIFST